MRSAKQQKEIKYKHISIKIPEIFSLDDDALKNSLKEHASEWKKLWSAFAKKQEEKKHSHKFPSKYSKQSTSSQRTLSNN